MVRRMVIAALCRGKPFFADLTLFERSSNLRDHLTLPPTRGGARRTRVILEARITAPLSAFIKAGLSFFLSLLISSPALPWRKLRSLFFDHSKGINPPPLPSVQAMGFVSDADPVSFLASSIRGEHVIKRINREQT